MSSLKKFLFLGLGLILGTIAIAYAAPAAQNFNNIQPFITDTYNNGSSANEWLNLFTKNLNATGTTTLATTTTGVLNGTIVVGTPQYPFGDATTTANSINNAVATCASMGTTTCTVVYIPRANLLITPNIIKLKDGVSIHGDGDGTKLTINTVANPNGNYDAMDGTNINNASYSGFYCSNAINVALGTTTPGVDTGAKCISITGGSNLIFRDIRFEQFEYDIGLDNISNSLLDHIVDLSGNLYCRVPYFTCEGGSRDMLNSHNLSSTTVTNSILANTDTAIRLQHVNGALIANNQISGGGIEIGSEQGPSQHVLITGNKFNGNTTESVTMIGFLHSQTTQLFPTTTPVMNYAVDDVRIIGNSFISGVATGPAAGTDLNVIFAGIATQVATDTIADVDIEDNTFVDQAPCCIAPVTNAIKVMYDDPNPASFSPGIAYKWKIANNTIRNFNGSGLKLQSMHDSIVNDNNIYDYGLSSNSGLNGAGITVYGNASSSVKNLQIFGNTINDDNLSSVACGIYVGDPTYISGLELGQNEIKNTPQGTTCYQAVAPILNYTSWVGPVSASYFTGSNVNATSTFPHLSVDSPFPQSGALLAYWPLDNTVGTSSADISGNATSSMQMYSNPNLATTTTYNGKPGQSWFFTATSTDAGNAGPFTFPNDHFTVSFWFKNSLNGMQPDNNWFDQIGGFQLFRQGINDIQTYAYLNAPGDFAGLRRLELSSHINLGPTDGMWHKMDAVVFVNSTGHAREDLYLDGSLYTPEYGVNYSGDATIPSGNLFIGNISPPGTLHSLSNGYMQRIKIYSDALTSTQVSQNYSNDTTQGFFSVNGDTELFGDIKMVTNIKASGVISGSSFTSTASSTFGNGISLTSGCFFYNGACLVSGGSGSITNIATNYPILGGPITTTGTLSFGGLSTTTPWSIGQIPMVQSNNTISSIATGTVTSNGGITATVGQSIIGTGLLIGCTTATASVPGCLSASDWTTFNNKASFAYPFTFLNTYATGTIATTTSISTQGLFFSSSTVAASQFPYASTTELSAGNIDVESNSASITLGDSGLNTNQNIFLRRNNAQVGGIGTQNSVLTLFGGTQSATNQVLIRSGPSVAIGTTTSASTLIVSGKASIGADYSITAPTNGLIVEGNTGIGTSTPNANLAIQYNYGNSNSNVFVVGSSTNSSNSTYATLFNVTNTGTVFAPNTTSSGGAQTGYWCYDANGQLIRDTVVCIAVSARRFKQDINPLHVGLNELLQLQPVSYMLKPDYNTLFKDNPNYNGVQYSLVADDVQKVDPHLVTIETATTTFEGQTYAPGTVHGLSSYENWVALFTQSIKDFYKEFQALVARVDGDEKKLNALQTQVTTQQKEIDTINSKLK